MIAAINDMANYIRQLEEALMAVPHFDRREAYTMQEKHHVARQDDWRARHNDVLQRARGSRVDVEREREVARLEAAGKVRLTMSRVRMMNQRVLLGDPTATPISTDQALDLIERELMRL